MMSHSPPPPDLTVATLASGPPLSAKVGLIHRVLDGLFEAACVVDGESLTVLAVNAATETLLGRSATELIGAEIADLADTPEEHLFWMGVKASTLAGIDATDSNATLHSDSLLRRADGQLCPVERRIVPIELPSGHPAWLMTWLDLSPQQQLKEELDHLAAELGATLETSTDAILVTDRDGAVRGCNAAYLQLFRLPEDTSPLDDRVVGALRKHVAEPEALNTFLATTSQDPRRAATCSLRLHDGRTIEYRILPHYARGDAVGRIHALHDLSAQLASQARLQMVSDVFDTLGDAIFVLDGSGCVIESNRAAQLLAGMQAPVLQGLVLAEALHDPNDAEMLAQAQLSLTSQDRWDGELIWRSARGDTPVQVQMIAIRATAGSSGRYVVIARDLSVHKAQQTALLRLSNTDVVTGLPNRHQLAQRVDDQIARLTRDGGSFALMSIGLDRFKQVSNAWGHQVSDRVLVDAAKRLTQCIRADDVLAHLGSGAFVMMLSRADAAAAERVARRVLDALSEEMVVDDVRFNVSASVGAALYPIDGQSIDTLLTNADNALQEVQGSGQGALRFYQPRMNSELRAKVQMDHAMREGLRCERFYLQYQPQFSLQRGHLVGAEALLRWRDPVHGEVSPGRFIPVAEETGFIAELGDFVLKEAVSQAANWLKRGLRVPIAVNISALQFQQAHFVARVFEVLEECQLPPELLELELTESILLGDMSAILAQLNELAAEGVRLAIDDFGTGYSSLGYLKRLPIDRLKIDRSFVQDLPHDASDTAIVRSVVDIARALDLTVVAEGVETEAQRDHLAELGCHEAQGYLFARPLSLTDFETRYAPPIKRLLRVIATRDAA